MIQEAHGFDVWKNPMTPCPVSAKKVTGGIYQVSSVAFSAEL